MTKDEIEKTQLAGNKGRAAKAREKREADNAPTYGPPEYEPDLVESVRAQMKARGLVWQNSPPGYVKAARERLEAAVARTRAAAALRQPEVEAETKLSALFAARARSLGLSVRDVAIRLEVSEARARQILSAKNLREDNIQRVAAALGLRLVLALVEKT